MQVPAAQIGFVSRQLEQTPATQCLPTRAGDDGLWLIADSKVMVVILFILGGPIWNTGDLVEESFRISLTIQHQAKVIKCNS
jgi:hypothetical protein